MKCPSCGAEIGSSKICEFCGTQISYQMQREQEKLNKSGCPRCGSSNTQFQRENQGEIRGKQSKQIIHRTVGFCKDCGATWYPNSSANEVPKKRKTWLWILGWLFIFPVPLTILIVRNQRLNKWLKVGIIAVGWIAYLLIVLCNRVEDNKTTEPVQPRAAITETSTPRPTALPTPKPTAKPTSTPGLVKEDAESRWEKDDSGWHYLDDNGEPMTGWVQDQGVWYYLDENGIMQTGWLELGGYWYYLKESGEMAENESLTVDGKEYSFDEDGHMLEETPAANDTGVTPEFKAAMDSYEAFFDEYCEFMKAMSDDPTNFAYLMEYAEMMTKYAEMTEKLDAIDEDELSPADSAYYIEVMARIDAKLLEAANYMS